MHRRASSLCGALSVAMALSAPAQREPEPAPLRARMLASEDARSDQLTPLYEGLTSLPELQIAAVRGLGRQERPDLIVRITPLLVATHAAVRAEAANALAQSVTRGEPGRVFELLQARAGRERDPMVRGVLARSIGRLSYGAAPEVLAAQAAMLALLEPSTATQSAGTPAPSATRATPAITTVLGVAAGLETLARRMTTIAPLGDPARERLAQLTRFGLDASGREVLLGAGVEQGRRVRRLAVNALAAAGALTQPVVTSAVADVDAQVRRLAVAGAGRLTVEPWILDTLERALFDTDPRVRIEALRQRGATGGRVACQAARITLKDANVHVALTAIDLAGAACAADVAAVGALDAIAVLPDSASRAWHRSAHALVALARLMPDRTRARLGAFASHPVWQVRLYAARAAGVATATATLEALALDAHDNVRDAALVELARRMDRRGDPLFIAALGRSDAQVVRTAARALAGTPRKAEATRALVDALARFTVELRDTSRDVRIALLERLEETGASIPSARDEMTVCLTDFDPVVAARAAAILTKWRGTEVRAQPRPLPRQLLPTLERLDALAHTTVVVTMARGGVWRMRLFPEEAPTNVARFARMAATGAFNGRTFYRVEPTFVIQGGSAHGNEYEGEGPFTRDEVGLRSHLRGTVGISTRGRDTGDGQIFVNLVDNVRLDHNYTIIGEVVDGLDVIDGIVEGDAIERIVVARSRP